MSHWTDFLDPDGPDGAYLPWKKVEPRVGISRTTAWRLQKAGDFPVPYVMSPGRVGYRESEIEAWKASRGHRAHARPRAEAKPTASISSPPKPVSTEPASWTPPRPDQASLSLEPTPPAQAAASPQREREPRQQPKRGGAGQMTFDF